MMSLSLSCEDKLILLVNGQTIKDLGTFNPQSFSMDTRSDRTTIEYINTEIRYHHWTFETIGNLNTNDHSLQSGPTRGYAGI